MAFFRRIRINEKDKLKLFCKSDRRWIKYYTGHSKWVDMALKDVFSRTRVVFGAYDTKKKIEGSEYNPLIACIFLKLSDFENSIEFKNLILPTSEVDLNDEIADLGKTLIEKAIRFCEVRSINKIEIELPQNERGIINLFLSTDFKIVALRERFNSKNPVCILERTIGDSYHGDPFDYIKFGQWLLNSYIPCTILKPDSIEDIIRIKFEGKALSKAFSDVNQLGYQKRLLGELWIIKDSDSPDDDIIKVIEMSRKKPSITLLLADEIQQSLKEILNREGIISFSKDEYISIAGGAKSSMSIPIDYHEIGGVVTVLEEEEILEYFTKETLTYYLLSGINSGLTLNDSDDSILFFYCPNWKDKGPGIIGASKIQSITRPKYHELLQGNLPKDTSLKKEDLEFYGTYSDNERLAQLHCGEIILLSEPILIEGAKMISNKYIKDYLISELISFGSNSAYIDDVSTFNLMELFEESGKIFGSIKSEIEKTTIQETKFKVGLSFSSTKRDYVERVAIALKNELGDNNVFYDKFYEGQLSRDNLDIVLNRIYKNCDLIVIFFSDDYEEKVWCGLEWKSIRSIVRFNPNADLLMPIKFNEIAINGLDKIHGEIFINSRLPEEIARIILDRLEINL